jgi:hypothetical protein
VNWRADTCAVSTVMLSQTDPWDVANVAQNEKGKQ